MTLQDTPFFNKESNTFEFPYRIMRDLVVIWPIKGEARKLSSILYIPETVDDENLIMNKKGVILGAGPGYRNRSGVLVPNPIREGMLVSFNNTAPFRLSAKNHLGDTYELQCMCFGDIVWY